MAKDKKKKDKKGKKDKKKKPVVEEQSNPLEGMGGSTDDAQAEEVCTLHDQRHIEEGERFWDNVDLRTLDLSLNALTTLPEGLTELPALQKLLARSCRLTALPQSLFSLENLVVLDLSHNSLSRVPDDMWRLVAAADIDLSHNQLTQLPELGSSVVSRGTRLAWASASS